MKRQFLLLLVLLVGATACEKSSSEPTLDFSAILTAHPWIHNGFVAIVDGKVYVGKNTKIGPTTYTSGPNPKAIFTFKTDGTYTLTNDDSDEGKWTLAGNKLTMTDSYSPTGEDNFILTNTSTSGLTMSLAEINASDQSDLALLEVLAANDILGSNGLKLPNTAKKIQIQINLIAK